MTDNTKTYEDIIKRVEYKSEHGKFPPDGPWANEPDFFEWIEHQYTCVIWRNDTTGAWCGYVLLPEGHPLHGVEYQSVPAQYEIDIHGGVTYSGKASELMAFLDEDPRWAYGFDCGHCYDATPLSPMRKFPDVVYRDADYAIKETNSLAQQLHYISLLEVAKLTMPPNCE